MRSNFLLPEANVALLFSILLVLSPLVVHEMGHWAVLHRYRVPVIQYWLGLGPALLHVGQLRIGMLPIGGAVVPEPQAWAQLEARSKMWVALAGPLLSFAYALVLLGAWSLLPAARGWDALLGVAGLSAFIGAVNLVPIPPLDGFQALAAWRESSGRPFSERTMGLANRLGAGMVYGVGFFVLAKVFFR